MNGSAMSRYVDASLSPAAISRMIARGVASEVERTVYCDAHDAAPAIAVVGATPDGVEYAITGCCDRLRKKARKAIDDLLGSGARDERRRPNAAA